MILLYDIRLLPCFIVFIFTDLGFFFVLTSYAGINFKLPHLFLFVLFILLVIHIFSHMLMLGDTVLESLAEVFEIKWRRGYRRMVLGGLISTLGLCSSLGFITTDGIYLLTALDSYLPWTAAAIFALLETIAFVHIYGIDRILNHLLKMNIVKTKLALYWQYILPTLLLVRQFQHEQLKYIFSILIL